MALSLHIRPDSCEVPGCIACVCAMSGTQEQDETGESWPIALPSTDRLLFIPNGLEEPPK